jgi:phospholipid transport system substrate-binding protein
MGWWLLRDRRQHGEQEGVRRGQARRLGTVRRGARRPRIPTLLAAVLLGVLPLAARGQPDEPAARVNAFYGALLETMKQAKALGPHGRYEKLFPIIAKTFDVPNMTRIASGPGWQAATAAQQAALVDAFSRMMTATYAARFDDFTGETFEVAPAVDQAPSSKLVRTRLVQSNGKPVTLNYLMHGGADGWKIADVYLDGTISELAARRAEFASVMKSGGPDALVTLLRQRADKLLGGR